MNTLIVLAYTTNDGSAVDEGALGLIGLGIGFLIWCCLPKRPKN